MAVSPGAPTPPVTATEVTDQALPFQCATAGAPAASEPATHTSLDDRAVTLCRPLSGGAVTVVHDVPFHRVTNAPAALLPTAHASVREIGATSYRNVLPLLGLDS